MPRPSPSSTPPRLRSTRLFALTLALWPLICLASATTRADEPDAVFLEVGAPAPFAGIIFSPGRAAALGSKLETCELHRQLDGQLAAATAKLQLDGCARDLKLADSASADREALLQKALSDAQAAAQRPLWEEPGAVLTAGIILGVAATVGAVYLVGELRPLVPKP